MEESRKQFEKYLTDDLGYSPDYVSHWVGDGDFKHHPTLRSLWQGWQASRAAIEINLPPAMGDHQMQWDGNDWNMMREHAAKSIRAAGLKIKGE